MMHADELRYKAQKLVEQFDLPWVCATSQVTGYKDGPVYEVTVWKEALAWVKTGEYTDEDLPDLLPNLRRQLITAGAQARKPEPLPF